MCAFRQPLIVEGRDLLVGVSVAAAARSGSCVEYPEPTSVAGSCIEIELTENVLKQGPQLLGGTTGSYVRPAPIQAGAAR